MAVALPLPSRPALLRWAPNLGVSRFRPLDLWRPRHGLGATVPTAAPDLSAPSFSRPRDLLRLILTTADGGFTRQSRHMRRFRRPGLSLVSDHRTRLEREASALAPALLRCRGNAARPLTAGAITVE